MAKPYRIKHKASGLYYQPARNHSNMEKKERCCGNCLWMGREDILGNGWCYKKDCETSCDKVCKKHEF